MERPLKSHLGKAVVLNTFVDKEYNRKEPINDRSYFHAIPSDL